MLDTDASKVPLLLHDVKDSFAKVKLNSHQLDWGITLFEESSTAIEL